MATHDPEITELLNRAAQGDDAAARQAFPAIYQELRQLASAKARRLAPGASLQTTELVHEAYVRIVGRHPDGWAGMRHFYFTAARAMRDIVVDHARRRASLKRGGDRERVPLEDLTLTITSEPDEVLELDALLTRLERDDAEGHRLLLLRFFTGLSMPDAAEVMQVPLRSLERRWRFLRVWLARELEAPSA
jgi:RNA polymerase sigma factor (TIGR02999 family)